MNGAWHWILGYARGVAVFLILVLHVVAMLMVTAALWGGSFPRDIGGDTRTLLPVFFLVSWVAALFGGHQQSKLPTKGMPRMVFIVAHLAVLVVGFLVSLLAVNLYSALAELGNLALKLDFAGGWQRAGFFVALLVSIGAATSAARFAHDFVVRRMTKA